MQVVASNSKEGNMRFSIRAKIVLPMVLLLSVTIVALGAIAYALQAEILNELMKSTTDSKLSEFSQRIDRIAETAQTLKTSLAANYLRLARTVAQTIAVNPAVLEPARMTALAKSIGIDEIHVTDAKGVLRWGNVAGFFGFDFTTSDQTKPFLRILSDPSFELAQEPQPRGADKVLFQYIGVARRDRPGIVQIGVAPK